MFDITTARARIGLATGDATKDSVLTAALSAAMTLAEGFCSRLFPKDTDELELTHFDQSSLQVARYPIESVTSVTMDDQPVTQFHVDRKRGRIVFDARIFAHTLKVEFVGGYDPLPADLEMALWLIFDMMYNGLSGESSEEVVKSITSAGAKVEFDMTGAGATGYDAQTGLPSLAANVLRLYTRGFC